MIPSQQFHIMWTRKVNRCPKGIPRTTRSLLFNRWMRFCERFMHIATMPNVVAEATQRKALQVGRQADIRKGQLYLWLAANAVEESHLWGGQKSLVIKCKFRGLCVVLYKQCITNPTIIRIALGCTVTPMCTRKKSDTSSCETNRRYSMMMQPCYDSLIEFQNWIELESYQTL